MILFIDIETIPGMEMPHPESIKVPATYKDAAKIRQYQLDGVIPAWKAQALDSMKGRIIAIGYACDDDKPVVLSGSEQDNITMFGELIEYLQSDFRRMSPTWIGWNISTFDIPWLWRKALQYNLSTLSRIIPKNNRNMQRDLMREWAADYRDYVSLANCAKFLGIDHEGEGGAEIFDLWQRNDLRGIEMHCERDIITTREIYRRLYE